MTDRDDQSDEQPTEFTGPRDQIGFDSLGQNDDEANGEPGDDESSTEDDPEGQEPPENRMGLLDHLNELRTVLIQSFFAALVATILCWFWSADLMDVLIRPIEDEGIYFTAPNEAFLTRLKLSAVVGFFVVAPFIFFKIYSFVLPGLYKQERKVVTPLILATTILFYLGVSFAFFIVIPQVMTFLLSFGTEGLSPLIGVGPYFDFVSKLCLAFGLVFELPLLVLFLSVLGIVNPRVLLKTWRYAIIAIAGLSAVLTPPDVVSQLMMTGPVLLLYFGSVLVSIVVVRKKDRADEAGDE